MFAWYKNAAVCYAYLCDVPATFEGAAAVAKAFAESEWFDRGWTLQELLAPRDVIFCDRAWQVIGHKCALHAREHGLSPKCAMNDHKQLYGPSLNAEIHQRTNIDHRYLEKPICIFAASIACRLSWAAYRKTTRIEDTAYCLLGMLKINMPLLYGEGSTAFMRLQEEIIRRSSDQSIFCWTPAFGGLTHARGALLAHDPRDFARSSDIVATGQSPDTPYALTNIGLEIRAKTKKIWDSKANRYVYVMQLNCGFPGKDPRFPYPGIGREEELVPAILVLEHTSSYENLYQRVEYCSPEVLAKKGEEVAERLFYVRA
ncbi:hypothetical protein LTR22_021824 [Elasticomyces elasticus]|nr:hypothetical protein LTR22_021824 [Elasticomyces elasticus]